MPRLLLALALLLLASLAQADDGCLAPSAWANWRGSVLWFRDCYHHIFPPYPPSEPYTNEGMYIGNEPLIPPQCRHAGRADGAYGYWAFMWGGIEELTNSINLASDQDHDQMTYGADCKISFRWLGRLINKKPKRMCLVWTATMPSGQVKTGADTYWYVGQHVVGWTPYKWTSRPKGGCPGRSLPNPLIPRP